MGWLASSSSSSSSSMAMACPIAVQGRRMLLAHCRRKDLPPGLHQPDGEDEGKGALIRAFCVRPMLHSPRLHYKRLLGNRRLYATLSRPWLSRAPNRLERVASPSPSLFLGAWHIYVQGCKVRVDLPKRGKVGGRRFGLCRLFFLLLL